MRPISAKTDRKAGSNAQRRDSLRDTAQAIQAADNGGMSYGELAALGDWFTRNARRYGLVTELRGNGII